MWWGVLGLLACLPSHEAFLSKHRDTDTVTVTVEEGQPLTLTCVTALGRNTSLQWLAPSGFTIFLNGRPAFKNSKYQLLRHSATELSIAVPRASLRDEGIYRCLHYSDSVSVKPVLVRVLATPSKPNLDASVVKSPSGERVELRCSTEGSKPPPRLTWQLSPGLEVAGETHHVFEADGKKCNSTSTLIVHTYSSNSTAHCVVRHEGLQGRTLVTLFRFEDLAAGQDAPADATEESPLPSQALAQQPTSAVWIMENSSTTEAGEEEKEENTSRLDLATEAQPQPLGLARSGGGILLLAWVSFLIFILLLTLQLAILKLRRAHVAWKKENEILEHTLENYRSRSSNEETSSQEKDGQTSRPKRCENFITRLCLEARTKRKENARHLTLEGTRSLIPESVV